MPKYKDRARCNWKKAIYLNPAGDDGFDGYEIDEADGEMLDSDI